MCRDTDSLATYKIDLIINNKKTKTNFPHSHAFIKH